MMAKILLFLYEHTPKHWTRVKLFLSDWYYDLLGE